MTDEEIISALKSSNESKRNQAVRALLGPTYRNMIRSFLLKNNGSEADVADMHQSAIIELFEKIQRGKYEQRPAALKTYLYAIVRNKWLKTLERQKRYVSIQDTEEMNLSDFEVGTSPEAEQQIVQMLDGIMHEFAVQIRERAKSAPDCITLLKLKFYDNAEDSEIAIRYGMGSSTTVRTRRFKCLEKLRAMLTARGLNFESFITAAYES